MRGILFQVRAGMLPRVGKKNFMNESNIRGGAFNIEQDQPPGK